MELSDLRIFRAVARAGGVTRAAEQLHRVQSNVTTRVKQLEQELEVALFLREGRRLQLTPAGRLLLSYADRLLALADEACEALQDGAPRGVLRLGAMESTAAARLPPLLSAFHDRYADVTIELRTGAPPELVGQVLAGELDAALVAEPVRDPRLEALPAFTEELLLVASAQRPPTASARGLAVRTVLAFHPGCPYRKRLEEWFAQDGVPIERIVELASYHAILGCAVAGMGVALMPRSVLETFVGRTRLGVRAVEGEFGRARTLLVWRKAAPQAKVSALAALLPSSAQRHRQLSRRKK
jgi:DNA-binding transcriptional LysR family regulator